MIKSKFYKGFDLKKAETLIRQALNEDAGKGDVTSNLLIPAVNNSEANLLAKEPGVIAGIEIFKLVHKIVDPETKVITVCPEGQIIRSCSRIAVLKGKSRSLLKAERLSLNILQRMSGIASAVHNMTMKLNNPAIKILDTRKTTPNFRLFEKLAVKIGGGENHRFGLYDMILIKDNHIEANGGIEKTLLRLRKIKIPGNIKTEIEVKDLSEFRKVQELGKGIVDIVMLDNFKIEDIRKAAVMNKQKFKIEISGGVNLKNIHNYSNIKGVNYISTGSVTHSARSMDLSLDFIS